MLLTINKNTSMDIALSKVELYLKNNVKNETIKMECETIISEIIYNIQKYAPQGSIELFVDKNYLHIKAKDYGEGIQNLNDAIKDGYSTSHTLGLGLATIFRLSDEIDIQTSNKGTLIKIKKSLL